MPERASPDQRRERSDLDPRYGKIGISAVAAAVRYRGDSKNPAYAPGPTRPRKKPPPERPVIPPVINRGSLFARWTWRTPPR